jgi:hypothetical protein
VAALNSWFEQKKGIADFRLVYISEAHPTDGWQVRANVRDGVLIGQHTGLDDRLAAARRLRDELGLKLPILVDGMDDAVAKAFAAWPDRVAILGGEGRLAYIGRPGPRGFDVGEAKKALDLLPIQ